MASSPNDPHTEPGATPPGEPAPPVPSRLNDLQASGGLGRELGGDLPCIVCGYNLRGISIRAMCPECGTGVRATILALVDPLASELRPIAFPRLVALGLVLWTGGAAAASLLSWLPHIADLLSGAGLRIASRPNVSLGVLLSVGVSGIGSLALVRPHDRIAPSFSLLALLGSALYLPLVFVLWQHQLIVDSIASPRYFFGRVPTHTALQLLIGAALLVAAIILCLRPNARLLVARSLILRTGRVDRQTLYAIAIAAGLVALGATMLRWLTELPGAVGEFGRSAGVGVLGIGSLLVTIGLVGAQLDSLRIAQAILLPRPTLKEIIRKGARTPKSRLGRAIDGNYPPEARR